MALENLLDLEVNKVSRKIEDYSMLITAPSGFGKSPFLAELYGENALFLAFENSHKGIAGIHSVNIDSYTTLEFYLAQLMNPAVREKYEVIVLDTLSLFDALIENSITDSYGKEVLSDCLKYNKAYKIVDKKFIQVIKKIQNMNYTMVYVCHPAEKKMKLADGTEYIKYEPKVSDRIKSLLIPEVDIRFFCHFDQEGKKVIYTQTTPYFDARCRVGDMPPVIPFSATALREEFANGIERKYSKEVLVDELEHKNVAHTKERDFKVVAEELMVLGNELAQLGFGEQANIIVEKELGLDNNGNQRTLNNVDSTMTPALETIIVKLNALKEEKSKAESEV